MGGLVVGYSWVDLGGLGGRWMGAWHSAIPPKYHMTPQYYLVIFDMVNKIELKFNHSKHSKHIKHIKHIKHSITQQWT